MGKETEQVNLLSLTSFIANLPAANSPGRVKAACMMMFRLNRTRAFFGVANTLPACVGQNRCAGRMMRCVICRGSVLPHPGQARSSNVPQAKPAVLSRKHEQKQGHGDNVVARFKHLVDQSQTLVFAPLIRRAALEGKTDVGFSRLAAYNDSRSSRGVDWSCCN